MPHPSLPGSPESGNSSKSPSRELDNKNSVALNAFSRVMAVLLLMLLVGVGGSYLDKWLGTTFLTLAGFLFGGAIAIVGMMYVVRAAEFEKRAERSRTNSGTIVDREERETSAKGPGGGSR